MIFYFSCTGNTRWAAHRLASALNETLVDIANSDMVHDYHFEANERIGFCFPVHGWRPPRPVFEFVKQLSLNNPDHHFCWALCTAGDDIGQTMEYFDRSLGVVGLHLDSAYSLIMPESYVGLPFMDVDKPEREREKIQTADEMLQTIIPEIKDCRKGIVRTHPGAFPRTKSLVLGAAFSRWIITDRPFRVSDACIKCGKCAEVCPMGDILGGRGQVPQWKHDGSCLSCFACYHHCPVKAIHYGHRTNGKGQYYFECHER